MWEYTRQNASENDYLMHAAGHKYIKRYMTNGKWRYVYADDNTHARISTNLNERDKNATTKFYGGNHYSVSYGDKALKYQSDAQRDIDKNNVSKLISDKIGRGLDKAYETVTGKERRSNSERMRDERTAYEHLDALRGLEKHAENQKAADEARQREIADRAARTAREAQYAKNVRKNMPQKDVEASRQAQLQAERNAKKQMAEGAKRLEEHNNLDRKRKAKKINVENQNQYRRNQTVKKEGHYNRDLHTEPKYLTEEQKKRREAYYERR